MWNHGPPSFLAPALSSAQPSSQRSLSTTNSLSTALKKVKKQDHRDTFALRQAKARKDANLSRQAVLKEQRAKEFGDPIRGITTPFVESFDTVVPQAVALDADAVSLEALKTNPDKPPPSPAHASKEQFLDHGLRHEELDKAMEYSRWLTEPMAPTGTESTDSGRETKVIRSGKHGILSPQRRYNVLSVSQIVAASTERKRISSVSSKPSGGIKLT